MRAEIPKSIGRYEIVGLLGQGGMGVVYRGRDQIIDRPVAIKLLGVDKDGLRDRFLQEARSAGKLHHPNIVTIFEYGDHQGDPFIAMELVDGVTLAQVIATRGRLEVSTTLDYVRQMASALDYAHGRGVIHRDVKPANIMLAGASLKLVDFGIARMADSSLTHSGVTIGTPNYMSPEQVCGHTVDRRSDIFSVGLVFYELLSGVQAFPGKAVHPVMHAVVNHAPVSLAAIVPDLDPALVAIVGRAIEKEPDLRYSTLAEMLAELDALDAAPWHPAPAGRAAPGKLRGAVQQEALSRRRAEAIEHELQDAQRLLEACQFVQAVEACERAALFDPDNARVLDLLDRAREAVEQQQAEWLARARAFLADEDTEHATDLIDRVLELNPASIEARQIQATIEALRRRRLSTDLVLQSQVDLPPLPADPDHPSALEGQPDPDPVPVETTGRHAASGMQDAASVAPTDLNRRFDEPVVQPSPTLRQPEVMTGRAWLLVPPNFVPEHTGRFRPAPPRANRGPAVLREVTPRAGDRDWFAADPGLTSPKAASRTSVMVSIILHGSAAAAVAAVLVQPVVPPRIEEKPRFVVSVPTVPAPQPAPPKPTSARPRVAAPRPEVKPMPVEAPAPPNPQTAPVTPPPAPPPPTMPDPVVTTNALPPSTNTEVAPLAPPPPGPPGGIDEAPVSTVDSQPQPLRRVNPSIPVGASGVVVVKVLISSKGVVVKAQVLTETPYREEIRKAAEACVFRPAMVRNRPVAYETTITFNLATRR